MPRKKRRPPDVRPLTPKRLQDLPLGETARDSVLKGFLARRLRDGRVSFEVRRQGANAIQKIIGHDDALTLSAAREAARKVLGAHALGQYQPEKRGLTIESAWPLWRADLNRRHRSQNTIISYQAAVDRIEEKVRRTPLKELGANPSIMLREYERIAKRSTKSYREFGHGKIAAIYAGRFVRGLFNYVKRRHEPTLSGDPTADLNLSDRKPIHELRVLKEADLPKWWAEVQKLPPIRQQAHLFLLLSGLRRESLQKMEWKHWDGEALDMVPGMTFGVFHIATAKGDKPFDLVLSSEMATILAVVSAASLEKDRWVWPGGTRAGHVGNMERDVTLNGLTVTPHALRRTYASLAYRIGCEEEMIGRFLSHGAKAKTVTAGYIRSSAIGGLLIHWQSMISRYLKGCVDGRDPQILRSTLADGQQPVDPLWFLKQPSAV